MLFRSRMLHHISGSHYVLKHPEKPNLRVTVPYHNKDLKRGTLASILHQASLSPEQFDALVSFTFNLGGGALQRSRLRALVNREEHDEVLDEFPRWVWAGGRVLRGLVRRRLREARLYGT